MPRKRTAYLTATRKALTASWRALRAFAVQYAWWEACLLAVGLISFVAVVVILFVPLGSGPGLTQPSAPVPAAGSPQFIATVSNSLTLPVEQAPPIQLLNNGDAFLRVLLADIDGAKRSINFMVYIWADGIFSDVVLAHLEQKLRSGVQVRVMLDAYGGVAAPGEKFERFKALGGKVATFHSLMPLPWTMARDHKRNHRRSIVIDGTIGYTGGIAVDDTWLGNARNSSEWRDVMFRVGGSMAAHLQGGFAELWASTTGELLVGDRFYPVLAATPKPSLTYIPLASAPSPDLFEMENFMLLSLLGAQREIDIVTPYFLPDESVKRVLIDKARAGVAIRILVPNEHNDNQSVRHASQYAYEELLQSGVRIYEFQPTFIHTKLLIVDGVWSVIGSANMDNRSRKLNDEIVFGISDAGFSRTLEGTLAGDLRRATEIKRASWEQRGLWQKFLEVSAQAFVQQY